MTLRTRTWGHEQRELLSAGSKLRHLTGKKPAQLKVITSWTRYFGRPRMVCLHFIHLKEYYFFNLLPSPPTQRKTISTKKSCKTNKQTNNPAPGKKSKHELEPAWKHEQQYSCAKEVHRSPTTQTDISSPSFPLSFGRLLGMHSTQILPFLSVKQVALCRAKSSGGQHEDEEHMWTCDEHTSTM